MYSECVRMCMYFIMQAHVGVSVFMHVYGFGWECMYIYIYKRVHVYVRMNAMSTLLQSIVRPIIEFM